MGKLNISKQNGFTVVELMIAMFLLLIVLSLGYMLYDFGVRSFDRGERRAIAQQGIRTTADLITSEIRYASHVSINPGSIASDDYYYIYQDGDSIHYQDKDKSLPARILLNSELDQILYSISFIEDSYEVSGSNVNLVIKFSLEAVNVYSLDTNVFILNLNRTANYIDLSGEANHIKGIKYLKPF